MKHEELQIANGKWQMANWKTNKLLSPGRHFRLHATFNLHFAFCILHFAIAFFLLPQVVHAADTSFPRGPGLYFNLFKLIPLVLVYLAWVRTCWWVDADARQLKLPTEVWNPLIFFCGLVGLVVIWLLPWFWVALVLLLALYLVPTFAYVNLRNEQVPADEKVLTKRHFRELGYRYLWLKRPAEEEKERRLPIRFISKSSKGEVDARRMARAQESKGYRSALQMVYDAITLRGTDIHMEPTKEEMTVRFRIDGILQPAEGFPRATGDGILNIFKVLGDLDITEKRKPQDGSFSAEVEGRPVDFRLATAGSVAGEKLVMRILDKARQVANLERLGMRERMHEQINALVTQPHGLFIVCGPTGAGKSTTLYACLNEIDRYQKNVITVENPVEYQIDNVTQIEINEKAGKTFASELRSILRQDPDVIYIGEIRDQETAEIACQAAQTGHMVFTTLHANDTITALGRLIDLGVAPFLVGSAVSAVLGQRLVRLLCPKCKIRYKPNPDLLRKANLPVDKIKHFYRAPTPEDEELGGTDESGKPIACSHCGGTGYFGRTGVFELMAITDPIRDLIRENPNLNAIKTEAIKTGMKYLQEDGLRVVIEGKTSIQELLRVCK
jgi:type II secretory ATPase GspE/PulE/Tfp pilus assembly ATPase PilB-like protein